MWTTLGLGREREERKGDVRDKMTKKEKGRNEHR